ncbi:MAG TPA: hypothetical protein PLW86_07270, partial [Rhodocyclaceae bacterium]|nr:hypothetical protein [Rhodocyclaceae bacterium]
RQFADRIIGLAGGTVIFDGKPGELSSAVIERLYGSTPAPQRASISAPNPIPHLHTEGALS